MHRCHECRKRFTQKRIDQVFCKTLCRMKWFARKAKAAMKAFEALATGDNKTARDVVTEWNADAAKRSQQ